MSRKDREKQRRRAQQARQNGAIFKGPTTHEGMLRHGQAAKSVIIIDGESREALQEIIDAAVQTHKPQNAWEAMLLDNAISSAWRSRRAASFETALTNMQMQIDAPQIKKEFTVIDPITRQAISTRNLDQSSVSPRQLARYEAELSRSTHRWITILQHVQSERRYSDTEAAEVEAKAPVQTASAAPSGPVPESEPTQPVTLAESVHSEPKLAPLPPQTATETRPVASAGPAALKLGAVSIKVDAAEALSLKAAHTDSRDFH